MKNHLIGLISESFHMWKTDDFQHMPSQYRFCQVANEEVLSLPFYTGSVLYNVEYFYWRPILGRELRSRHTLNSSRGVLYIF